MKRVVEDIRYKNTPNYKITCYTEENKLISKKSVYISMKQVNINGFVYILLFDNNHRLLEAPYRYLNIFKSKVSIGTRLNIAYTIKIFYEFLNIYEVELNEIDYEDVVLLYNFLAGINTSNEVLKIQKHLTTHQIIINFNRLIAYIKFAHHKEVADVLTYSIAQLDTKNVRNLQNYNCPAFISLNQMRTIHNYILNDTSIDEITRMEYDCIYRIMFFAGLRRGEALGLTLEDFIPYKNTKGQTNYKVLIRNRVSDRRYQYAKRCMNVTDKSIYSTSDYQRENVGYQTAYISKSLYDGIEDYYVAKAMQFQKTGKTMPIADSIMGDKPNYYIFSNITKPTPLNRYSLEQYTRKMFVDLGIAVDTKVRTTNLLHRFRHGYAMYLLYVKRIPKSEAKHYMRQRSDDSLNVYDNPTQEMRQEMMSKLMEGIDEYIIENKTNQQE